MKYVLIGNGGHSKVISDMVLSNGDQIVGYLDDKYEEFKSINNIVYGPIITAQKMVESNDEVKFLIAIGNNLTRKLIAKKLDISEEYYATVIHKSAVISSNAVIRCGTVVMPNAVINADAQIGRHTIINTGSVVEHDCKLGDFVHISPHVALTGGIQVEEGVSVGAGSALIPNIKVGEWSVIGSGATVITDIPSHCTAVGTPARVINKLEVH